MVALNVPRQMRSPRIVRRLGMFPNVPECAMLPKLDVPRGVVQESDNIFQGNITLRMDKLKENFRSSL